MSSAWTPPPTERVLDFGDSTIDRISPADGRVFYSVRIDFGGGFSRQWYEDNEYDAHTSLADELGLDIEEHA